MATPNTPLWVPLLVAAVGVAGSVTAALLTQRASRHREDERWRREREVDQVRWNREKVEQLRERRVTLYIDLAEYVQRLEARIEAVTDEYGVYSKQSPNDLVHPERLTARVKLLAPEAVRDAWATFVRAEDAMFWELWEDPDGFHNGGPYLKAGTQSVLAASRAAGDVHAALRAAMNDPDLAD